MNTKKTAMISSTSLDLPQHRKQAREACERQGFFPSVMENLPARDADAIRVSLEAVAPIHGPGDFCGVWPKCGPRGCWCRRGCIRRNGL
jgi:hypothetical protein